MAHLVCNRWHIRRRVKKDARNQVRCFRKFAVVLATPLATQMRACRSFLPNCTTLKSAKYNVRPKGGPDETNSGYLGL